VNSELSWQSLETLETRLMLSGLPPTINFTDTPYVINEGDAATLNASTSDDPETDPLSYSWDLNNDGTYGDSTEANPTFSWAALVAAGIDDDGAYTIGLQVADGTNTVTDTTTLTVDNAAPVIELTGDDNVDENSAYTLTLGAVTDGGDDTPSWYFVDWGDGSDVSAFSSTGEKAHTFADNGSYTITVNIMDEDGVHDAAGTKEVTVDNASPSVISGSTETLAAINEDIADGSNTGETVNELFLIHYSDPADSFAGVAIVANAADAGTEGAWQYSTDGGENWNDVSVATDATTAVVLDTDAVIRFNPVANYNGAPGDLTVRLWDGAGDLTAGQTNDVSGELGGGGGLSGAAVTLGATVDSINDAPTFTSDAVIDATEDAAYSYDITTTDADGDDVTILALTKPDWLTFTDNGDGAASLTGTPTNDEVGDHSVSLQVSDGSGGLNTQSFTVTVANVNDAPTVANAMADQNATEDVPFSFQFASDTFADVDAGDTLTYTATLADDSELPAWLSFDAGTRTFSGTAANDDTGTISVKVTASDGAASVTDTFDIAVAAVNDAPVITDPGAQGVTEDGALTFSTGEGTLVSIADVDVAGSELQVTLTVTDGTLTLAQTTGLTITAGADGAATMTFTGAVTDVNAAIDGMVYAPTVNYAGGATLSVDVSDQGATGAGGEQTDSAVVAVTVNAVDDPAVVNLDADDSGGSSPDFAATFNENGAAVDISDADATLADVDSANLASLTVTITNFVAGDTLDADVSATSIAKDYNAGAGVLTLSGADSVANYQAVLRTVTYVSSSEDPTDTARTIEFVANDGASDSAAATATVTVNVTNDNPVPAANDALTVNEGATGTITNALLQINDVDNTAAEVTYTITVAPSNGELQLDGAALGVSDTFTQDDIDNSLLTYVHDGGETTTDLFTFTVADGAGGTIGATDFDITITPLNDDPIVSVNGVEVDGDGVAVADVTEEGSIVFEAANSNLIEVADADAAAANVSVTVAATKGTITLGSVGGLDNLTGNGTATVSFDATIVEINTAVDGLTYQSDADAEGAETITITLTDNGATGAGGGGDVVKSIVFNITPVNDAPVLNNADAWTVAGVNEDPAANDGMLVSDLIATGTGGDPISDIDDGAVEGIAVIGADNANGAWQYSTNGGSDWTAFGAVGAGSAVVLTVTADDRVRFAPDVDYNGAATITVRAWDTSDSNASGTSGVDTGANGDGTPFSTATVTAQITVTAVNDAPVLDLDANDSGGNSPDFTANWTEGDAAVTIVDADATVTDVDSANLSSVTVTITNLVSGDTLDADVGATGIAKDYDPGTGVLTLAGGASKADYQTVLRTLTFVSSSDDPTSADRTITIVANDGADDSTAVTATVVVTPVNDAAVVNLDANDSGGGSPDFTSAYTENAAAVSIVDVDAAITDVDDTSLESMTVTITNVVSGDILDADVSGASIAKSYDSGTGVLSLIGTDTVANYQAVLRTLTFASISNNPTDTARTIEVVINDGADDSAVATATVNVTPVNDAPTLTGVDATIAYTEGDAATDLLASATIAESDDTNIESATITITNFVAGDVLAADVGATGIVAAYDGAGELSLTGSASVADYQTVLRTVAYVTTSDDPTAADRTITVVVNDGDDDSGTETVTVQVTPVNDAPVLDLDADDSGGASPDFAAAFTEGGAAAGVVDADATVSDGDNTNLGSLTATISSNFVAGDTLAAAVGGTSITADYDSGTGVLTLSGTDTAANYQTVLRTLTFESSSEDPTDAARTITIVANDGAADSTAVTSTVTVTPVNDAATVDLDADDSGGSSPDFAAAWTEGGAAVTIVDADAAIADSDDTNLESMTVTITNFVAGDVMAADVGATGIAAVYDGAGELSLTGTAAVADYQTVLRTVTFVSTSDDPTAAARTIEIVVNDGDTDSTTRTATVSVTPINDPAVVSLDDNDSGGAAPDFSVDYTENSGATTIVDTDAVISDVDDTNLESMTITITNVVSGDILDADVGATGIGKSYNPGSGALTLTGTVSVADYQAVLRTLSYASSSDAPTDTARIVEIVANDGDDDSTVATATINVQNVNDDPAVTVPGAQSVDEGGALTLSDGEGAAISIADADAGGSDVTVTLEVANGTLTLADSTGLTDLTGDGTATAVLTGSVSAINTALAAGVDYAPTGDYNGAETLTATVNDGGAAGSGGGGDVSDTVDITVNAVNDDPVVTVPDAQSVDEDGSLVFSDGNGNAIGVADVDSAASDLTVTLEVTQGALTLADAGAVAITAGGDGTATMTFTGTVAEIATATATLTYAPAGDYNGADTLTITVNDGGATGSGGGGDVSDTVDITVNAVNDDPTITVPGAQTVDEDATLTLSDGEGNAINVADVDAAAADVQVTLAVDEGALTMADTTGLTDVTGDGTATVVLTGSVAAINTALDAGVGYDAAAHYNGADTLTVTVNDLGATGSGGGGDVSDTVAITVTALNDDPVILLPGAQTVDEDESLVFSTGNGNAITVGDVDSAASDLAVTLEAAQGTLTLADAGAVTITAGGDGTATMTFTGTIAEIATALATLTYAPTGDYNGADTLTVTVNDGGATGAGGGGDVSDTVDITVAAVNDAPTISVDGSIVADTVAVDDIDEEASFTFEAANSNAITVAEPDAVSADHTFTISATKGALTLGDTTGLANLTGDGTASVSFDGTTAEIGNALEGLQYAAETDSEGLETLTLTLNDNSNTGSGGDIEISRTITFTITPANDAPVLDGGTDMTVTGIEEDTPTVGNAGISIPDLLATGAGGDPITDVDAGAVDGVAITAVDDTNGTWQFSTDGGTSWSAFGPVSNTNAVVLTATANDKVRFRPNADYVGTVAITLRAWDTTDAAASGTPGVDTSVNGGATALSTATADAFITVSNVNDAPVLDNSVVMTVTGVDEDVVDGDNTGTLVSDLLATGAGGDPISDVDAGAAEGVAVTDVADTNGQWQYSVDDGATWTAFGSVDDFSAIVLDGTAKIRFVPNVNWNGTAMITFRAWDATDGNSSGTTDVAVFSNGGATAYSAAAAFARITVAAVNDAPTVDAGIADQATDEDVEWSFQVPADAFVDVDAGDTLTYAATQADDSALPAWLSFDVGTRTFSGTPTNNEVGVLSLKVTADDGAETVSTTFNVTINNTNDAPTLDNPIANQAATEDQPFSYVVPANTFSDVDVSDTLTWSATQADDSALPAWLSFDAGTRTFSGTPANGDVGTISVKVTVDDGSATASDTFDIVVSNVNDAPTLDDVTAYVPINADAGHAVVTVAADDVDAGDTFTYAITAGDDGGVFAIDEAAGEITVADADALAAGAAVYNLEVTATDAGGLTATGTVTVNVSRVCLAPSFVSVTLPDRVVQGRKVTAKVRLTNEGTARATARVTLRYYARPDGGGDDILLKTAANLRTGIAVNGSKAYTTGITLPEVDTLPAGDYTLCVQAQYGENISTATDDTAVTVAEPVVTIIPQVVSTGLPVAVLPGATATTAVRLTNEGNIRAIASITLRAYVSVDGTLDGDGVQIGGPVVVPSLMAPDGTRNVNIAVTIPEIAELSDGEGDYQVLVTSVYNGDDAVEAVGADAVTIASPFIDLAAAVKSTNLPVGSIVPGDKGPLVARITNVGNIRATGGVIVTLYASETGDVDGTAIQLGDPISGMIDLAPCAGARDFTFNVTIPETLTLDTDYHLVVHVQVDPEGDLTEGADVLANNVGATAAEDVRTYELRFGTYDARRRVVLNVTDPDTGELVRFAINRGGGWGQVTYDGAAGAFDVALTGTGKKSRVTVTTPEDVEVDLGDITLPTDGEGADVNLGSFTAGRGNLLGDVDISGGLAKLVLNEVDGGDQQTISVGAAATPNRRDVLRLNLGEVTDLSIDSLTPIKTLGVDSWTDAEDDDAVSASWLATLTSGADFQANLNLDPAMDGLPEGSPAAKRGMILGGARIGGTLSEAAWAIEGKAGKFVLGAVEGLELSAANAGKITVNGNMVDAQVSLDAALTKRGNALGSLNVMGALNGVEIRAVSNIGKVVVGQMVDSLMFAGVRSDVTTLPEDGDFTAALDSGLQAAIRKFTVKAPAVSARRGFFAEGDLFTNSLVAAGSLGRVTVREVTTDNADTEFGFAADKTINLLIWAGDGPTRIGTFKKLSWVGDAPADMDDFVVRIV